MTPHCPAENDQWRCELPTGHTGDHQATTISTCLTWTDIKEAS